MSSFSLLKNILQQTKIKKEWYLLHEIDDFNAFFFKEGFANKVKYNIVQR